MSDAPATLAAPSAAPPPAAPVAPPPAAPALGSAWYTGWVKPDGSLDHSALDKAPDGIKSLKDTLGLFTKFDDLVDSYGHQRKLLSGKGLMAPRENATQAEKDAYRSKLRELQGVPEKPEAYGIDKMLDAIPEQYRDREFGTAMAKVMHEAGLSPSQVEAVIKPYTEHTLALLQAAEAADNTAAENALKEANAKLDKAWGLNRQRMEQMALRGALTGGIDPNSDLFKNPDVRILCANFARMVSEDKLVADPSGRGNVKPSKEQLHDLLNDKSHRLNEALWKDSHPMHGVAKAEFDRLTKLVGEEEDVARR